MHRGRVERVAHPGHTATVKGRPGGTLLNHISIAAPSCAEARTEIGIDRLCPVHTDIVREMGVDTHDPGLELPLGMCIEMYHLPGRMDAGIGATGTDDSNWMVSDPRECSFDLVLHGTRAVRLHLPAAEAAAVVFHAECNAAGRWLLRKCHGGILQRSTGDRCRLRIHLGPMKTAPTRLLLRHSIRASRSA